MNTQSFSQQLTISLLSFPVPESQPGTSNVTSLVWIILLLSITGVLIILIMITLSEMMCHSGKRCQNDDIRRIRYKKQIDFKESMSGKTRNSYRLGKEKDKEHTLRKKK